MSEGRKDDKGKLRWHLLRKGCVHALEGVIRVLMYGEDKYGAHNWKDVADAEQRYRDALDRHLADIDRGIEFDPDTGEDNWFHVATNALFVAELRAAKRAKREQTQVSGIAPASSFKKLWRKHTPGERPVEAAGLSQVEYRLRGHGDAAFVADPRYLDWREIAGGTITHWRPYRG